MSQTSSGTRVLKELNGKMIVSAVEDDDVLILTLEGGLVFTFNERVVKNNALGPLGHRKTTLDGQTLTIKY